MAADSVCVGEDDHLEAQKSDDGDGEVRALESTACSLEPVGEGAEHDVEEDMVNGTPEWPATGSENELEHHDMSVERDDEKESEEQEIGGGREVAEDEEEQKSDGLEDAVEQEVDGEEADDEEADGEERIEEDQEELEEELEDEGLCEEGEEEQGEEEGRFEDGADDYGEEEEEGAWEEGEEEEDQWEDEVEEDIWETEPAEKTLSEKAELAKQAWDSKWPAVEKSDAEVSRQWGNRRNRGPVVHEKVQDKVHNEPASVLKDVAGNQAREQLRRPNGQASLVAKRNADAGSGAQEVNVAELQKENRQLRLELGQAMYKVQQLGKLRDQAAEAQRKEIVARQKEARAIKELELAKEYVGKRDAFARSEKAELMQKVKQLEDTLAAITGREDGLKEELAEATSYRSEASQMVEESHKNVEKYKNQAMEYAKNVKSLEQRLHQLEEQRQQDKTRLRELAHLVRGQQEHLQEGENAENARTSDLKIATHSPGKRSGSKPPEKKSSRKAGDAADGKPTSEDAKSINNAEFFFADDSALTSRLSLGGVWRSLKPLVLGSSGSGSVAGGCSGAPGRGKAKKGGRDSKGSTKTGAASKELYLGEEDGGRQNLILLALVVLIACLAVFKTCFSGASEDIRF
mmetsp:Transcript_99910/g.158100  ORF Transcript_99910/g.158100 Transcript_99910/m.158100 type:complete len:632 (+) Transcript_99910:115-2010(+)|eukprot:CAMPEP_0169167812 /NCGR_PEP_ID=MMETSP1015-20121227/60672_1 /TAXON_ID=342587 /ORGANISM="Karlodinium micrum, Strain CCMP2283" /LENGTH=631 /DNA_ID=CAMNT_0009240549 /DNA_START=101 /DNA_END=1996 /DNA_ORIENTATION=-